MDWTKQGGGKVIGGSSSAAAPIAYGQPSIQQYANAGTSVHRLGGQALPTDVSLSEAAASAAILRLSAEEEEAEKSCGCQLVSASVQPVDPFAMEQCLPCEETAAPIQISEAAPTSMSGTAPMVMNEPAAKKDFNRQQYLELVMLSVDESIANCMSLDVTAPVERLFTLRSGFETLIKNNINNQDELKACLQLLDKIIGNARNLGLSDLKYRQVKTSSAQFQRILGGKTGSSQILQSAGFDKHEGEFLKLSRHDVALLYLISSIVESALEVVNQVSAATVASTPLSSSIHSTTA